MKKALIAVGVYVAAGVAVELAFVMAARRRAPGLPLYFTVTEALLWPVLAFNVVAGKTLLSQPDGTEPAQPATFGAIPKNATEPAYVRASSGAIANGGPPAGWTGSWGYSG